MSPALLDAMFDAVDNLPLRPDFILNTGDDPAHDVWNQSDASNLAAIRHVAERLQNRSVGRDVPVVNAFGNHAHAPVNQFRGPGYDAWLYEGASDIWQHWLPDDARKTLSYGGYYTMRVAPKLRAVVMHSTMFNSGDGGNWFFMTNRTDIGAQFPWLLDALMQARELGEKVLLLRHCPISDFDFGYDELMANLTSNFSDVIVASFAGHAHTSWFTVLRDPSTQRPVDTTYVSGSGTPGGGNPTFRVFHYDTATFELLDYDQYWVDLDEAIATGIANFKKDHSARAYYNMTSIGPEDWEALAQSWLSGNDDTPSWKNYARAMTRGRSAKQNRVTQACVALSVTNSLYKECKNRTMVSSSLHGDEFDTSRCGLSPMGYRTCNERGGVLGSPIISEFAQMASAVG